MTNEILGYWSQAAEDPFEPLFEAAPILMHSIDRAGVLVKVSAFWAQALGYERDEMLGLKSTDLMTRESREYAFDEILPRFYETGAAYNIEYDFVRKSGEVLSVLMSAIAQYDSKGNFVRSLAIMFDNTENKRLMAELQHKQRMDALGQLVGGVAHDFNNILTVIQGNLEFLREDPEHPDRASYLSDAWRSCQRGASLTQMLLSYGRRSRLQPEQTDLNSVVLELDQMLRRVLPTRIEVALVTAAGLWGVNVDLHRLETAVLNIVNNARDAMPAGGKITIETCNVRISEEYVSARTEEIQPGRYVMLAISDTGDGIPEDVVDRVFEPYFTTKPVGQGSGLGLSMVFGFVKQSGGTIRVYSEVGFGTTFKLYFPAAPHVPEVIGDEVVDPDVPSLSLSDILVVEDEDDVRRVIVNQLRRAGFSVSEAASGDDAHRQLQCGVRPKLLITDVIMPGTLQGPELAKKARAASPELKVIFISGFPREAAINGNGVAPDDVQFTKPVGRDDLIREVQRMLS